VSHCFDGQYAMTLGFLFLEKPSDPRLIAHRKVGRFHKGPGQILIPVLGIAAAFVFAVA
jgi:hypothetical protein